MKPTAPAAPLSAPANTRSDDQHQRMVEANRTGTCPFCDIDWTLNKQFMLGKHWRVMPNAFPYPSHSHHLIIVPLRHITDISDLTADEMSEWWELNLWAIKEFNLPGGGLVFRFGDLENSAGTLTHLHSHIQVPDKTGYAIAVFFKDAALTRFLFPPKMTARPAC